MGGLFADKQTEFRIIKLFTQNFQHTFVYFTDLCFPQKGDIIITVKRQGKGERRLKKSKKDFINPLTFFYPYAIIK